LGECHQNLDYFLFILPTNSARCMNGNIRELRQIEIVYSFVEGAQFWLPQSGKFNRVNVLAVQHGYATTKFGVGKCSGRKPDRSH